MRPYSPTRRRTATGFSIIELLVSISIIVILVAISFPFISALTSGSRIQAGLNVAGMSSDVARQWVQAVEWANDGGTTAPTLESYSGTAAIFCPTNEVRIVFNDRNAQDTSNAYLEDNDYNGFRDISQVEYIRTPEGAGVVGIERFGTGENDVRFIAPPFAIAYNEFGQLNYGDASGYIYYDGDGSGKYNRTATRTSVSDASGDYDPSAWGNDRDAATDYTSSSSLKLPFEAIECVPGVVVYSAQDFRAAGLDLDGGGRATLASAEGQWLQENGETIFFSPHTGIALRDEQE